MVQSAREGRPTDEPRHPRGRVPGPDRRADGDPARAAALARAGAADQLRPRDDRGAVRRRRGRRRDARAAVGARHLVAVPVRRTRDRGRRPARRAVAAARPPRGACGVARGGDGGGDARLRLRVAGRGAARARAADAVHRLHHRYAGRPRARRARAPLGADQGDRRRDLRPARPLRRAAVELVADAGLVVGRAGADHGGTAGGDARARTHRRAVRAGVGVLAAGDDRRDRRVPDLPARRVLPGRRVPRGVRRPHARAAPAAARVGREPARDADVRVVLRAVLLLLPGRGRAHRGARAACARDRRRAQRRDAAAAHRHRLAAAPRRRARERAQQPARRRGADADADLRARAGDDPARALRDRRCAVRRAAVLHRHVDAAAVAGAGAADRFRPPGPRRAARRRAAARRIDPPRRRPMRWLAVLIAVALALIAVFAWLNWAALTAPAALSLGVAQIQAPPGLVLLVAAAVVCALLLVAVAIEQGRSVVQVRRNARDVQALRAQVDQAEASRLKELRDFVAEGLRNLEAQHDTLAHDAQERVAQLERRLQERIDESTRTLSAYIGEVEDKLDRRLGPPPQ